MFPIVDLMVFAANTLDRTTWLSLIGKIGRLSMA